MSKFLTTALTNNPDEALGPVAPGGDDFLSRVTNAISSFKEVLKIARELKGLKGELASDREADQGSGAPKPAPNQGFPVALMLQHYGDKTVGEIMENLSPLTLNQIMEQIKRAGFGK